RELYKQQFSTVPMEAAHFAVADAGEPGNEVDVRLIDFKIRMAKSDAANPAKMPAKTAAPPTKTPSPKTPSPETPATEEETPRGVPRSVWVGIIAVVLTAIALGTWLALRSRRGTPAPATPPVTADAPIEFACAKCKKSLKVKRTSAGKQVKCPQ